MFWTALVISAIVTTLCQLGTANRIRGTVFGFLLSVLIATVVLMQSGHWVFADPSYYGIVAAAALVATVVAGLSIAAVRRNMS